MAKVFIVQWLTYQLAPPSVNTQHPRSVTDAIDGIFAGKGAAAIETYRHWPHQPRRRAERPQSNSRGKHGGDQVWSGDGG